ncbi:MAG: penicillin acylase family protein [Spirochaetes bacterium]|nr:penicillin acylase family protein [Spirochaetota bacterium]
MKKSATVLRYGSIVLIALLVVLFIAMKVFIKAKLPTIDGAMKIAGLQDRVEVVRDRWGVPHITAKNGHDAYFALGYTIAQDRLFQIDLQRHLARGELSELLGGSMVEVDKQFRTFLFRRTAEKSLEHPERMNQEALALLDAFLEGVNHFIDRKDLPIEYTLLGSRPRRFTRLDCMSMLSYMSYSFAEGIHSDSLYTMLEKEHPGYDISELFPLYTREEPVTIMENQAFFRGEEPGKGAGFLHLLRGIPGSVTSRLITGSGLPAAGADLRETVRCIAPPFAGSNSFCIAPSRSATGGAILANDPHIAISNPSVWYEAHMKYDGYETYGYFLPVIPFPLLSHNSYRACGITMFENDDLDLYEETFDPTDDARVKYRGQWVKATVLEETIKVKGENDVKFRIRVTPHGPVITDFLPGYKGKPVSMCWVFHREENPLLNFIYGLNTAKNLHDFEKAISVLAAPGLNYSYADRDGNIAWWAAGKIVVRPPHVKGDRILDGASGRDEWIGYLPFAMNPHLVNPKSGIIVTANNQSTKLPLGPVRELTGYWCPTDRAARITELLSSKERWSIEDLQKVQTDLTPMAAQDIIAVAVKSLEPAAAKSGGLGNTEVDALEKLRTWNRVSTIDSAGAAVYHALIFHIMKEGVLDELGEEHFGTFLSLHGSWNFFKAFMKNPESRFWDDCRTPSRETRDDIILRAFRAAVRNLSDTMGGRVDSWQWGRIHTIEYVHPVGMQKPMNLIFNIGPLPAPGDAHHINRLKSKRNGEVFKVYSIPSTRRIVDMRDPSKSVSILPSGNSGNVGSANYDDQVDLYLRGGYRAMCFTPEQIEKNRAHRLVMAP